MHVAVTGASSGIGAAIVKAFAARGDAVTLVARRRNLLDEVAKGIERAFVIEADLGDPAKACGWIAAAEEKLGPIDVLVNNAGMQVMAPAAEFDPERGEAILRLNLHTPLRLTRTLLPKMIARGSGTIVDVASMAAIAPPPGMFYYNASKGGLAAASEALRGELRKTGVHVVTVYPGAILDTDMGRYGMSVYGEKSTARLAPVGSSAELARRIVRAVERRKPRVIYPVSGVLARHFPNLTRWVMDRFTPPLPPSETPDKELAGKS